MNDFTRTQVAILAALLGAFVAEIATIAIYQATRPPTDEIGGWFRFRAAQNGMCYVTNGITMRYWPQRADGSCYMSDYDQLEAQAAFPSEFKLGATTNASGDLGD